MAAAFVVFFFFRKSFKTSCTLVAAPCSPGRSLASPCSLSGVLVVVDRGPFFFLYSEPGAPCRFSHDHLHRVLYFRDFVFCNASPPNRRSAALPARLAVTFFLLPFVTSDGSSNHLFRHPAQVAARRLLGGQAFSAFFPPFFFPLCVLQVVFLKVVLPFRILRDWPLFQSPDLVFY